jgi:hypothetical protein
MGSKTDKTELAPRDHLASDENRFDWARNNGDVIVPEQRSIAVYANHWGQAVIRAEGDYREDDVFVAVDHAHIYAVIGALKEIADAPLQRHDPPETLQLASRHRLRGANDK